MNKESPAPSVKKLTEIFFRIGNTTFGGGYVTIGMLGRELVDTRRWISAEKFDLAFALARVTPGTNLIAFCAAIGALICGVAGAVAAVVALTAPSSVLAVLIMQGFESFQGNRIAMAAIGGTVAAVAGMMWATIWVILRPHVGGLIRNLQVVLIAGGAFAASRIFGITPLPIILAGTLIGFLWKDEKPT
ncbi:MAG: chromate transporter [Acidobacteriia bacterium]|nr:chromate transporter [Terriglobia bacterium]